MTERTSKVPIKREASHRLGWRRILLPTDLSAASLRVLETAVPLARDCRARLVLLFAVEPAGYVTGMDTVTIAVPDAAIVADAKRALTRIAKRQIPASIPVTIRVDRGRAIEVILRAVKQERIDLITLSTHGHAGIGRFLLGSTAELVVRHAPCPVFVVRPRIKSKKNHRKRKD
jgi:universal stress protein A